ncbi:hypothetical protein HYV71_00990 [Candidatus Uhrbacteria bacterium]|nr:hypothetical protein [Candidatus Uhrbacteria bacterium]
MNNSIRMVKQFTGFIACALIAFGAGFYGGTRYANDTQRESRTVFSQERAQMFRERGGLQNAQAPRGGGRREGSGFVAGEIISKDETSITLKLRDGGSQIILLPPALPVSTLSAASSSDLKIGAPVAVTGESNSDGIMTAQTIQIRPLEDLRR